MNYANSIGIALTVPSYIIKHAYVISTWEARGRYDLHLVVRIDVLKKTYLEIIAWKEELMRIGFKKLKKSTIWWLYLIQIMIKPDVREYNEGF